MQLVILQRVKDGVSLTSPYNLIVTDNYAYIAGEGSESLDIINVTNPADPVQTGNIASGTLLSQVYDLAISGDYAYMTGLGGNDIDIINISNPSNPVQAGSITNGFNKTPLNEPYGDFIAGNYLYVANYGSSMLQIFDITNATNPIPVGSISNGQGGALLWNPHYVIVSGNYAYIGSYSDNAFEIVNLKPYSEISGTYNVSNFQTATPLNVSNILSQDAIGINGCINNSTSLPISNLANNEDINIASINSSPIANFTASTTSGTIPVTVQFNDTSVNFPTSWLWNFGDGTTSTLENPVHVYSNTGNYSVTLTATNSYGNSTITYPTFIQTTNLITGPGLYLLVSNQNGAANYDDGPNNTYQISGGGTNQLHITTNPIAYDSGQITTSNSQSGTFYITTTGGRGSNDDLILLVAVKGPIPNNFALNIVSSGYVWTPGSANDDDYVTGAVNETFTAADFLYGPQSTIPVGGSMGVIYNGEDTSDPSSAEYLMFVDLYVGDLGSAPINNGAAMVQFTFTNLTTQASFDAYAWAAGYDVKWATDATTSGYNIVLTPAANFTANTTSGILPVTVQFTDTSTNNPTSWNWNFGDGSISTQQNPTHTYTTPGTYNVTLTATNGDGNTTMTLNNYITIYAIPVANFTANITNGSEPLNVRFTDNSTGVITNYNWNFGDGFTGTTNNPAQPYSIIHTYTNPGTYTVTETVTGPGGTNTLTQTDYITVNYPPPIAKFTANITNGTAPLSIQFNDNSTGNITSYNWNFGDGSTSTQENPTHTYTTPGTYNVTEIVTALGGNNTYTQNVAIYWPAPVAAFSANNTQGTAPLQIQFNDNSTGNITSYNWNFGDQTPNSTLTNPTHTYTTPGTYTITETVTGPGGTNTTTQTNYITINYPTPIANFTANTTNGTAPLNVQFNDQSTGNITSYNWNFGDQTPNSTLTNPTHTYTTPGTYTITETVTGPGGTNTTTQTNYITINYPTPIANFTANTTNGTAPLNIQFNDQSTGNITSYNWNFGDQTPNSTLTNPTHTYTTPGTYTITETVTGPGGSNNLTQTDFIVVIKPVITVNSNSLGGYFNSTQSVTLNMTETGSLTGNIYYTINGTIPTQNSTLYTKAIVINSTTTLEYIAIDMAGNTSPIYNQTYIIDKTIPTASVNAVGGLYNATKTVTISMSETGKIYYTINGTNPSNMSNLYTKPLTISSTTILKYLAIDLAGNKSAIYTQTYTIDKIPPKVISSNPVNNYSKFSLTSPITIKFSENIKASVNWSKIEVKNLSTGKIVPITASITGNTLTIKTVKIRLAHDTYQIIIPLDAIKDLAENNLTATYTTKFKTT